MENINSECFYNNSTQQSKRVEKGVVLNGLKRGLVRWSVKKNRYTCWHGGLLVQVLASAHTIGQSRLSEDVREKVKTGSRGTPPAILWTDRPEYLISKAVIDAALISFVRQHVFRQFLISFSAWFPLRKLDQQKRPQIELRILLVHSEFFSQSDKGCVIFFFEGCTGIPGWKRCACIRVFCCICRTIRR